MTHYTTLVQRCRSTNSLLADDIATEFQRLDRENRALRSALSDARPFVADSGDDEDPDAKMAASEVVAEIDRLIPSR